MAEALVDLHAEETSPNTQTYGRVVEIEGAHPQPKREELLALDGKVLQLVFDPATQKTCMVINTAIDMKGNEQGKGSTNLTFNPISEEIAAKVKVGKKVKIRIYHED